jgi:hypothetical protein
MTTSLGLHFALPVIWLLCVTTNLVALNNPPSAEWTIMVYMNAKNSLENAGLYDFQAMAAVGSSSKVNFVVELGRPERGQHITGDGDWRGVMRFRVTQGLAPVPASAINPDDSTVRHADMGCAATLADFVDWAKQQYPAKKYMLLIWSHGQGWRLQLSRAQRVNKHAAHLRFAALDNSDWGKKPDDLSGGFRSVSIDEDYGHPMYNRDIEDKLQGRHFDIIGFDACLMAMVETSYAFRNLASLMVASEELSPDSGWRYSDWMAQIVNSPAMDGLSLAKILVTSYKSAYSGSAVETSSIVSIDLSRINTFAASLSQFAETLQRALPAELDAIASARHSTQTLGNWSSQSTFNCLSRDVMRFHGVDLAQFLAIYQKTTQKDTIRREAAQLVANLRQLTTDGFVSSPSGEQYSSSYAGVSVYFPGSPLDFNCDPDRDGYDVKKVRDGAVSFPPEFVQKEKWADFLHDYLLLAGDNQHDQ